MAQCAGVQRLEKLDNNPFSNRDILPLGGAHRTLEKEVCQSTGLGANGTATRLRALLSYLSSRASKA